MRMQRKTFRAKSLSGVNRVKDGFFIGDEFAVRDFEFQEINKITHFVNCAGKQITNRNNKLLSFLTFNWLETDKQVLFEEDGSSLQQLIEFLREAENNGEAILIHSQKGINRSVCAVIAYFMADYKWSLSQSIEYLTIRRPGLKIQQSFLAQLTTLEQKLKETNQGATSSGWNETQFVNESEELVKNTYLNSKTTVTQQAIKKKMFNLNQMKKENIKLRWSDQQPGGRLNYYFGVPQRKNFKITTVNQSPPKYGAKGLFGSMNYNTNSFYQQQMKDKQQEQNELNLQEQAAKKAQYISILKIFTTLILNLLKKTILHENSLFFQWMAKINYRNEKQQLKQMSQQMLEL